MKLFDQIYSLFSPKKNCFWVRFWSSSSLHPQKKQSRSSTLLLIACVMTSSVYHPTSECEDMWPLDPTNDKGTRGTCLADYFLNNVTIFIQSSSALRSCVAILSCPCLWFWPWGFLIRLRFHSPPNMRFMVRHRAQVTAAQKKKHVAALALQQLMYSGSNMLPIDRSSTGQTSAEENVVRHCIVSLPTRCTMEIYLYLAETVYERYSCLLHPKSSDFQSCVAIFFKSSLRSGMCPTGIQHFQFPPITFFLVWRVELLKWGAQKKARGTPTKHVVLSYASAIVVPIG